MIAYAARTGTRRNLDVLRRNGWRLLVSARGELRPEGFRYGLDNGAWTAHSRGEAFDEKAFGVAVERLGAGADFVVVPDIVCGGTRSLDLSLRWLDRLRGVCPVLLLAVQDGFTEEEVGGLLGPGVGVAVGGSTAWKEGTAAAWGRLAEARGAWCHVLRVNTVRRIRICRDARATSFDGSSVSRFAVNADRLSVEVRQIGLFESPIKPGG